MLVIPIHNAPAVVYDYYEKLHFTLDTPDCCVVEWRPFRCDELREIRIGLYMCVAKNRCAEAQ